MKHIVLLSAIAACGSASAAVRLPDAHRVANVDFDGDGLADLVFLGHDEPAPICDKSCYTPDDAPIHEIVAIYLGRDHGTLSKMIRVSTYLEEDRWTVGFPVQIGAVGDLDGDGRSELGVVWDHGRDMQLWLLHGTADGIANTPYQKIDLPDPADVPWYNLAPIAAGDLDRDGHPDIVLGDAVLLGRGDGLLAAPVRLKLGVFALALPVGDIDQDGFADLVVTTVDGEHSRASLVRGGNSLATALSASHSASSEIGTALFVDPIATVCDLDGDGVRELIGLRGGRLTTYGWNHGALVVRSMVDVPLAAPSPPVRVSNGPLLFHALPAGGEIQQVAAVGRDLAIVTSAKVVEILCNSQCFRPAGFAITIARGDKIVGTLAAPPPPSSPLVYVQADPEPYVFSPGDFDGDGIADPVVVLGDKVVIHQTQHGDVTIRRELATSPRHIVM
jgi:hypothetical protein